MAYISISSNTLTASTNYEIMDVVTVHIAQTVAIGTRTTQGVRMEREDTCTAPGVEDSEAAYS